MLLSDGADNSGGIDLDTIAQIRQRRIPVHTIGFGREKLGTDVEITEATVPAHRRSPMRGLAREVTFRNFGYAGQKAKVSVRDGGKAFATREVTFKADGSPQSEPAIHRGSPGPRAISS